MIDPQYIGYFASVCIVLSFVMKKVQHIRLINLVGCYLWAYEYTPAMASDYSQCPDMYGTGILLMD